MYTINDYSRDFDRLLSAVPDSGWQYTLCRCLRRAALKESVRYNLFHPQAVAASPNPYDEQAALLERYFADRRDTKAAPQTREQREALIRSLYPLDTDEQTWEIYRSLTPARYAHLVRDMARQRLISTYGPGVENPERGFRRVFLTLQADGADAFARKAAALADLIDNDITDAAAAVLDDWRTECGKRCEPGREE